MENVEPTNKVLYNLVRANSSKRALKIRLSAIFANFIIHILLYLKLCNLIKHTPCFYTICLKFVLNKKSLCAKTLKRGFL